MVPEIQILTVLGLAAAFVAAWPLLRAPQFRRPLACASGSGLIALGATMFALVISGLVNVPVISSQANAQEPPQAEADESPAKSASSAPGSGSAGLPVPQPAASPSPAPNTEPAIAPVPTFVEPAGRPAWVNAPAKVTGPDVHTLAVSSEAHATERDARRALDRALETAVNEYVGEQLGSQLAPELLRYDARTIKQRFVKEVHSDKATYAAGDMYESFALLEFSPGFREELSRNWDGVRSTSRLTQLGLFAGAGLLFLASVFGYFRLDNATRGYYTGRLQFLTAAAILAVIGAGVFAARWIHWL